MAVATVLADTAGTAELPLTAADLDAAIAVAEPAEACTEIPHPN